MRERPIPQVGQIWCGRTHSYQRVEITDSIPEYQNVKWVSVSGRTEASESYRTFWAYFKLEGEE